MGYQQCHRFRSGLISVPLISAKNSHACRKLLSIVQEDTNEKNLLAHVVQLKLHCSVNGQNGGLLLGWIYLGKLFWVLYHLCYYFAYDSLPSSSNLLVGNTFTETSCQLCQKKIWSKAHTFGACKVALQQGRFTFRDDSVLHVLLPTVQPFPLSYTVFKINFDNSTKFVTAESKPQNSILKNGLLQFASDWILQFDHVDKKLVIPSFIIGLVLVRKMWRSSKTKKLKSIILFL